MRIKNIANVNSHYKFSISQNRILCFTNLQGFLDSCCQTQDKALKVGAKIIMPNITPTVHRKTTNYIKINHV